MDIIDQQYIAAQIPLNISDVLIESQFKDSDNLCIPIKLNNYNISDLIISFCDGNEVEYDNIKCYLKYYIEKNKWGLGLYTDDLVKCFDIEFIDDEEIMLLRLLLQFNFYNCVKQK